MECPKPIARIAPEVLEAINLGCAFPAKVLAYLKRICRLTKGVLDDRFI